MDYNYCTLYKYRNRTCDFLGALFSLVSSFGGVFNTIIPLALVGYEMILANSELRASLVMYCFNRSLTVREEHFKKKRFNARDPNRRGTSYN